MSEAFNAAQGHVSVLTASGSDLAKTYMGIKNTESEWQKNESVKTFEVFDLGSLTVRTRLQNFDLLFQGLHFRLQWIQSFQILE